MVDLQTVIDEINTGKIEFDYKDDDCCTTEGEVVILLKRLAELEKADVEEVKHGEWITIYSENGYHKECSVCGSRWMLDSKEHLCKETNYCPNCGAKMDGGKAE